MRRLGLTASAIGVLAAMAVVAAPAASGLTLSEQALATMTWQSHGYDQSRYSCGSSRALCFEVKRSRDYWKRYVGHDEPATVFLSSKSGSGNNMTYQLQLPHEPKGAYSNSKSYDFETGSAFWFGMAVCDTFSYPQTTRTCTPDSDSNAVNLTKTTKFPGSAYMELQFYAPGWVPQFADTSCDARKWCAALNVDSLSANPINGTMLNSTCQGEVLGGVEYTNFAYLTRNGEPQGPPNPLEFDPLASGQPGPHVLYMNPGDKLTVSLHDSIDGLVTRIVDHTTGQSGFMTASAGNEFGHIAPAPTGTGCQVRYYDFHPMYATSQAKTIVPWAAGSFNVAFVDEIGHFDFCTHIDANSPVGQCNGLEGAPGHRGFPDGDDTFCFPSEESLLYPATGCANANDPGFDGPSYLRDYWPNGRATRPTPIVFSSPLIHGSTPYSQVAFNTDLPANESPIAGGTCDFITGHGCSNPPPTDQGKPAFYPYYSTVSTSGGCRWTLGAAAPHTTDNFGGSSKAEYGPLQRVRFYVNNGGGATQSGIFDYQRVLSNNPC